MAHPDQRPFVDVRMRGFGERASVASVLALMDVRIHALESESIPTVEAAGRVLATAMTSAVNMPAFARSAMDGFAIRAADVPAVLQLVGESLPARPFIGEVDAGQAVRIMTGAPMPAGADAIVMAEHATEHDGHVTVREGVATGRHVIQIGEDVIAGREVLPAGRVLRPQDIGLLASIGIAAVKVVRRPRVALLVTGDELLPPGSVPHGYQIVDSNSPMLAALVARDGGVCLPTRYVPDRYEAVRDALTETDADLLLICGGTSVGTEDHAPQAVAELGELAVHGIAVRPASPTGIGFVANGRCKPAGGLEEDNRPAYTGRSPRTVFLLPGNPVACLCAYDLFAGRAVRLLGGRSPELPHRSELLPLASTVASAAGRVDYLRVKVTAGRAVPIAVRGASILSSTVAADGFVRIDAECESLAEGEIVRVWLYE